MTVRGVVNSMRQASAAMSDRVPRIQRRQSVSGPGPSHAATAPFGICWLHPATVAAARLALPEQSGE